MHTEWDTQTVTNTLAMYGVRRHTPAYYAVRGIVRFTAYVIGLFAVVILPHAITYTLIP